VTISDEEFEKIIAEAMDELPQEYIEGLNNVLVTYEDEPTPEQRTKLKLRCHDSLFGLYEGIPLTKRPAANSILGGNFMTLPDKITIFKNPIIKYANSIQEFKAQTKHTLWHEIAHYYGLDHDRIHKLENGEINNG
jgi:predicted Zn-dependent protease with MMP-like domain